MSNESLEYELQHLLNLAAPPFRENWIKYVHAKARVLADWQPNVYGALPDRLTQALNPPPCDKDTPTTGEASR